MSLLNEVLTFRGAAGGGSVLPRQTRAGSRAGKDRAGATVGTKVLGRRLKTPSSGVGQVRMSPKAFRGLIIGWGGAAAPLLALSLTMRWWLG